MEYVNEQDLEIQNSIINNAKVFLKCNGMRDNIVDDVYYIGINPSSIGGWTNCYIVLHFIGRKVEIICHTRSITKKNQTAQLYELLNYFNKSTYWGKYYLDYNEDRLVYKVDIVADNRDYDVSFIFEIINRLLNELVEHVVELIDQYLESFDDHETAEINNQNNINIEGYDEIDKLKKEIAAVHAKLSEESDMLEDLKAMATIGFATESKVRKQQSVVNSLDEKLLSLTKKYEEKNGGIKKNNGNIIIKTPSTDDEEYDKFFEEADEPINEYEPDDGVFSREELAEYFGWQGEEDLNDFLDEL